ncbi:MAG: hypothetical protein LJE68_06650 [Rhodobacter sp.]|nr:hypothetical protein [Rhodobacter sp.]
MQPQKPATRANLYLALGSIALALVVALVWARYDSGSGLILKVRRQVSIGDALAPTIAAAMIGLGGVMVLLQRHAAEQPGLSLANLRFLTRFLVLCAVSFALMRWTGPAVVAAINLFGEGDLSYRLLRDTAPWKYIGFAAGGTLLITVLIADIEGRLTARSVIIAVLAIAALIALYDLPFDDLQLPPNGDV